METIWIADAHRDDGKRFVVRADEKLTAFMELESAIRAKNAHATFDPSRDTATAGTVTVGVRESALL
jgi:hypothetical protein